MLVLRNVCLRAGAFELKDISLQVPAGTYGVLMGRTGCGKTTLLEAITGLRPILYGHVYVNGTDVTDLRPAERGIGYVPQDLALFPPLSVREHLAFALVVRRWPRADLEQRVMELAEWLGLTPLLDRFPVGLSGGEKQRVALGRALAHRPATLCLDEPLSALDEETRGQIRALLKQVQQRTGVTVLHVTHSFEEATALADGLFRLEDGRVSEVRPGERGAGQPQRGSAAGQSA
jgi:ABC-type sugar transport system ATPase subunit